MNDRLRLSVDCLHIFVLTQFALVQPLLYRLSRKTVYMADQQIQAGTILVLVGILCVLLPAALCSIELAVNRFSERWRIRSHRAIVFSLFVLIAMPALRLLSFIPGSFIVLLSPVVASLAAWAYGRWDWARMLVTAAAPALIIFPAQFLFFSPAARYLFPPPAQPVQPLAMNNPVPIVIMLFDEFSGTSLMDRDHQIDSVRYPHFASLAETATWYRNATSVHPRTEMAVPAILTGKYPRGRRPATVAEHPENLFSLLEATNQYEFIVFEPYTRLYRPPAKEVLLTRPPTAQLAELAATLPFVYLHHLVPIDVPVILPDIPMKWNAVPRAEPSRPKTRTGVFRYNWNSGRAEQVDEFLRRMKPPDQPAIYFGHIVIPHFPWCFLPSGNIYQPDDGAQTRMPGTSTDTEMWSNDELGPIHGHQRYLLQVGYADHVLGRLLDRLQETGLFEPCLLIVMADHGVSFRAAQSRRLPVDESLPELVSIPLFIKLPGQTTGSVSDRNVELVDVLPTIADVLELGNPPPTDGQSLVKDGASERPAKQFVDDSRVYTVPAAFPAKYQAVQRMIDLFGDGTHDDRLYHTGPNSNLIGQPVDTLAVANRSEMNIELHSPRIRDNDQTLSPCFFSGRVRNKGSSKPVELAIAINGAIRAVTRTYSDRRLVENWTAMIPEAALERGAENLFMIFAVESNGDEPVLRPLMDQPQAFQIH